MQDGTYRKLRVELVDDEGQPLKMQDEKRKPQKYSIIARDGYKAKQEVEVVPSFLGAKSARRIICICMGKVGGYEAGSGIVAGSCSYCLGCSSTRGVRWPCGVGTRERQLLFGTEFFDVRARSFAGLR